MYYMDINRMCCKWRRERDTEVICKETPLECLLTKIGRRYHQREKFDRPRFEMSVSHLIGPRASWTYHLAQTTASLPNTPTKVVPRYRHRRRRISRGL